MSSKKRKKIKQKPIESTRERKSKFILADYKKHILTFILVFVLLLIVLYPMAFKGLRPGGVDVIGSQGSNHQKSEYQKETGETVLWNSPVFSGMPIYHRLKGKVFSFDTFLGITLGKILYLNIWLYLIGFIGMFYLLRRLTLGYYAAVFGALGFIFIPHFMSLLSVGHFAKFRPIMYIPLVTFFFISFLNKKNLIWLMGFVFSFSIQIRTQHYQIIFYQIMILIFIGLYYLIKLFKQKQAGLALTKLGLIIAASVLIIIMIAQPFFVTREYTPYSIRGGTGEASSSGLSTDYATRWSLNPSEIFVWFMPRFFGGISNELYKGNKVPQLTDRTIPGYWGTMPFTQAYDYLGIVLLFMAILGLILNFKNGLIKTLLGLFLLSLLLSFGRHFPLLYNIFFKYVPAFNKFRVPAMISVILQIVIVIFAGFGLKSLLKIQDVNKQKIKKIILGIGLVMIILGLIPQIFGSDYSLMKADETEQYNHQTLSLIKKARLDMMQSDGYRLILFSVLVTLLLYVYLNKKIKPTLFVLVLIILLFVDQIPFVNKAEGELTDPVLTEKKHFRKSDTDKILLQDKSYYRIFAITENPFNSNDWSYYHNSIGGYSAAKLRIYQDIIESCLYDRANPRNILNWNIIKMLNNKYIISRQQLPPDKLDQIYYDKREELITYKTKFEVKPAWFVNNIQVVQDRQARFEVLNSSTFDAFETAILEKEIALDISKPDSSYITVKEASFNRMEYEIFNGNPSLLVISEIYYPEGWKCTIDDKETEIYKTNHILRSIYIDSPGKHKVLFEFSPERFNKFYNISLIGHIIAYFLLIITLVFTFKKKKIKPE